MGHAHPAVAHDAAQIQRVGARPAVNRVIAPAGVNGVVAATGIDAVVTGRAWQGVAAAAALRVRVVRQPLKLSRRIEAAAIGRCRHHARVQFVQIAVIDTLHPEQPKLFQRRRAAQSPADQHRSAGLGQLLQVTHAVHRIARQTVDGAGHQTPLSVAPVALHTNERQLLARQHQWRTRHPVGRCVNAVPHRLALRLGVVHHPADLLRKHIGIDLRRLGARYQLVHGAIPGLWAAHGLSQHVHRIGGGHPESALHPGHRRQRAAIRIGGRIGLAIAFNHRHHRAGQQVFALQAKHLRDTAIDCLHVLRHVARGPLCSAQLRCRGALIAAAHVQLPHPQFGERVDVHHIATGTIHPAHRAQIGLQIQRALLCLVQIVFVARAVVHVVDLQQQGAYIRRLHPKLVMPLCIDNGRAQHLAIKPVHPHPQAMPVDHRPGHDPTLDHQGGQTFDKTLQIGQAVNATRARHTIQKIHPVARPKPRHTQGLHILQRQTGLSAARHRQQRVDHPQQRLKIVHRRQLGSAHHRPVENTVQKDDVGGCHPHDPQHGIVLRRLTCPL